MSSSSTLSCISLQAELLNDVDRSLTNVNCVEDNGCNSDGKITLMKLKKARLEAQVVFSRTQALIAEMELRLVEKELQELRKVASSTQLSPSTSTFPASPQTSTPRRPYRFVRPVSRVTKPRYLAPQRIKKKITRSIHQSGPLIDEANETQVSITSSQVVNEGQSQRLDAESSKAEKRKAGVGDQISKKVKISSGKDAQMSHEIETGSVATEDARHGADAKSDTSTKHRTSSKKIGDKNPRTDTEKGKTDENKSNDASDGHKDQTDKGNSKVAKNKQSKVNKKISDENKNKEASDGQKAVHKHQTDEDNSKVVRNRQSELNKKISDKNKKKEARDGHSDVNKHQAGEDNSKVARNKQSEVNKNISDRNKNKEASDGQSDVHKHQADKDNSKVARNKQSEVSKKISDKNKNKETKTNDRQGDGDVSKKCRSSSRDSKRKSSKDKDNRHKAKENTKPSDNIVKEVNNNDYHKDPLESIFKKTNITQNLETIADNRKINKNIASRIVVTEAIVHASNDSEEVNNNGKEDSATDNNANSDIPLTKNTQVTPESIVQNLKELLKNILEDGTENVNRRVDALNAELNDSVHEGSDAPIMRVRTSSISSWETLVLDDLCDNASVES